MNARKEIYIIKPFRLYVSLVLTIISQSVKTATHQIIPDLSSTIFAIVPMPRIISHGTPGTRARVPLPTTESFPYSDPSDESYESRLCLLDPFVGSLELLCELRTSWLILAAGTAAGGVDIC